MKSIKIIYAFSLTTLCLPGCSNKERLIFEQQKCKSDFSSSVLQECLLAKDVFRLTKEVTEFDKLQRDKNVDCDSFKTFFNKTISERIIQEFQKEKNQISDSLGLKEIND
jgi:hypothetical protein